MQLVGYGLIGFNHDMNRVNICCFLEPRRIMLELTIEVGKPTLAIASNLE